jgi:hypothetical protein
VACATWNAAHIARAMAGASTTRRRRELGTI